MTVVRMTATFGKLAGETLTLTPGLNILSAPNESGKSTWCAFLRAMLYGVPTRERDRAGYLAEKNRYQPWSGAPMEGTMDIVWRDRAITIRRFTKGAVPFGGFEAVYTGTAEPVPGLTADSCGQTLLGVGREVYERTAFVGQAGLTIDGAPELERRIAALAASGEEEVSYSQVERRLKDWRNARQANRATGAIPRKEQELAEVEGQLAAASHAAGRAASARRELEELTARRAVLEREMEAHRAIRETERRARYDAAAAALAQKEAQEEALRRDYARFGALPSMEALRKAQGDLAYLNTLQSNMTMAAQESAQAETAARESRAAAADPLFPDMTPDQAAEIAAGVGTEYQKLSRRLSPAWGVMGALAGAAAGLMAGSFLGGGLIPYCIVGGVAGLLLGLLAVLLPLTAANRRRRRAAQALLDRYKAKHPNDVGAAADRYGQRWRAALEADRKAEFMSGQVARLAAQREELAARLREFAAPFAPEADSPTAIAAAISRALTLEDKLEKAAAETAAARRVWEAVVADGVPGTPVAVEVPPAQTVEETAAALTAADYEGRRLAETLALAQGELNSLGDPAALEARRGALEEELSLLRRDYEAIDTALEALAQANSALQARFSPRLNRRAGELFAALTGGAYNSVALSRDFEAQATLAGELIPRKWLALSKGTADQLYLAVRLAMCELTMPMDDPAPLVLDDALVTFDDGRMALALALLKELARDRQILLFTCQSRERDCQST